MEGSSSQLSNVNFGYDDGVILNCVRNRKKNTETPNCPVCSCTIRHGELESHLALELERLNKVSSGGTKRKLSTNSTSTTPIPGSSSDVPGTEEVDVTGCTGSDVYQRVHANRLRRLRARSRRSPPPQQTGECPVCNGKYPMGRLQRHALRCLRRSGASLEGDDIPDSSSEDGSIDVENDEPSESGPGGAFGAEYRWCGEWRVRATALAELPPGTPLRRASNDTALVVDGDEDAELYGPPQYSPSRIALQVFYENCE
ncbi:E3 ubiquitin-protein ligase RNF220 [Eumeta japonica]|uniref:E3 ubiquitin-protein ligase RNF220 n=1 Tax=Eumeta variegata TaxID=151549 RepID=A0A4C1XT35_EUMVA|nr:E3 ubiquitin-protein ligase RNF220 [Eumeta japonica]